MKPLKSGGILLYLLLVLHASANTQVLISTSTTNAGGNSFSNDQLHLEWSIGEMVAVNTSIEPTIIVSKGVLQPQRVRRIVTDNTYGLKLYPTITNGSQVWLSSNLRQAYTLTARTYNAIGQLIAENSRPVSSFLSSVELNVPLKSRGEYFIEITIVITENSETVKQTFRIQKA